MCADTHRTVEDDDTLKRMTHSEHAVSLVILLLLTHKEELNLRVVDHKLYLLFRGCGVEWY